MKKVDKEVRKHFVKRRMNDDELNELIKLQQKTTEKDVSSYLRKIAFQKPVTVKYRNQSADDFLKDTRMLKKELNAIGNNFNQAALLPKKISAQKLQEKTIPANSKRETLKHVFKYIKTDGPFQNAELHVDLIEVAAQCEECGEKFKVDKYKFVCPQCDAPVSNITEGKELLIHKIILEEPSYAETNQ